MGNPSDEKKMIAEPLLINQNPKGGFRTMPFIIANEAFERLASIGLLQNMILYLTREYNMEMTVATNVLFIWSAASDFLPILGGFVADSYSGRYPMIGFGCITSLLGMILLWFTAIFPPLKPPACDQVSNNNCEPPTASQLLFLYSAFVLMSIGAGGIRSSSLAFGADQLDMGDRIKNAGLLQSYFSWYYASVSASSMFAVTLVVYIQDNLGWKIGFGVPVVMM
ncbi:Protein NRT1/ PTR FAMILY 1.2 like, partial [Melia azedarach]